MCLPHFHVLYLFVRSSLCRRQTLPTFCTLFCLVHIKKALCVLPYNTVKISVLLHRIMADEEEEEEDSRCVPEENRRQWSKTCPLCREGYCQPRFLNECTHTFCLLCLQFLASEWPLVLGNEVDQPTLFCPVCRKAAVVPEQGIEGFKV